MKIIFQIISGLIGIAIIVGLYLSEDSSSIVIVLINLATAAVFLKYAVTGCIYRYSDELKESLSKLSYSKVNEDKNMPTYTSQRVVALFLLILEVLTTTILGIFGIMSASSNFQWLLMIIAPTALLPVVYFLTMHGVFARSALHASEGISAAIVIFLANGAVEVVLWFMFAGIVAMGIISDQSHWPMYILLSAVFSTQALMFVFYRKRLLQISI